MSKIKNELKNDPLMPLRHTAEHVLHTAMRELYPNIKLVMGPPIEDGFYFDFDLDQRINEEDFPKIEAKMQEIIDADLDMEMKDLSIEAAEEMFKDNPYKLDNVKGISERDEKITMCIIGDNRDVDLCAGPHIKSTGKIKAFKLLSVAGAYYKGDEKNKMLQRIYGTAFSSKNDLDEHIEMLELAKQRDHRKIGQELDLFTFSDLVGPGLPLWTPNGNIIREEVENWAKITEKKWGYKHVSTPHIAKAALFETSGHLPYYKDDMYSPMDIDGEDYYLKAMNCPHHHMIYKSQPRSYRDLPLRLAEYGMVYRYEQSGTLFGIMRVRALEQNDAHNYIPIEQAEQEFLDVLKLHEFYYNALGLTKEDYFIEFGLPDPDKKDKYHGSKEVWDQAEGIMRNAVKKSGIETRDNIGSAAFYGPKTDFVIKSSAGREFAISTVQLDLFMPERFDLTYTDNNGNKMRPAVIHRAPLGSHERFIGFLIEHFGGAFPVWLSPVQVKIIPISDKHYEYANQIKDKLTESGLRVEVDSKDNSMGNKIRQAQKEKIPYMLIVGDKEMESEKVSVRLRDGQEHNSIKLEEFAIKATQMYLTKSLKLW